MKLLVRLLLLAGTITLKFVLPDLITSEYWMGHADNMLDFFIFILSINVILTFGLMIYRKRKKLPPDQNDNIIYGLNNIFYIIVFGAALLTLLGFWGLDVRTLFTTLSIVAAAIAIVSKEYVSTVIGGIIISFSKELSVNDYVRIGDHRGRIIDIQLAKIALINEDDDVIFIPNDKAYLSEIINYTKREYRKVGIEFELGIGTIASVEALEKSIIRELSEFKETIQKDSYNLKIVEIHKDHISFKFQYIIRESNHQLEREIRKKTVRRVVNFIQGRNIQLAKSQPQSDLPG